MAESVTIVMSLLEAIRDHLLLDLDRNITERSGTKQNPQMQSSLLAPVVQHMMDDLKTLQPTEVKSPTGTEIFQT